MLEVKGISGGYGDKVIVRDVSLKVPERNLTALIGHNGAGKTTLLRLIFGLLKPNNGTVSFGESVLEAKPSFSVEHGISYMSESNNIFPELTVKENIQLAGHILSKAKFKEQQDVVLSLFPDLNNKWDTKAGKLSGGQRQMVALGISLMQDPKMLLLDEPSVGLAPSIVDKVMETLSIIVKDLNISVLVVEQNVTRVLEVCDYTYVMKLGEIIIEGKPEKVLAENDLWDLF